MNESEERTPEMEAARLAAAGWSVANGARMLSQISVVSIDEARRLMSSAVLQHQLEKHKADLGVS